MKRLKEFQWAGRSASITNGVRLPNTAGRDVGRAIQSEDETGSGLCSGHTPLSSIICPGIDLWETEEREQAGEPRLGAIWLGEEKTRDLPGVFAPQRAVAG